MKKEERFNQIVTENNERILRICSYYGTNYRDDLYQEVLINIWRSLANFNGSCAISTWVYRVAINTSLTFAGKAHKQRRLIATDLPVENMSLLVDEVEQEREAEQLMVKLQNELSLLPIIDCALISLVLEGLSMKEIADVVGLTESNVKVKIHRIKADLKTKLNKE